MYADNKQYSGNLNMDRSSKFDIIGIGVSALDFLYIVDRFPAGNTVQQAVESKIQGGGPVATAMVAAAKLGARTAMVDVLGDDICGDMIIREFRDHGVSTEFLSIADGEESSIASVMVNRDNGERSIVFTPGSASEIPVMDIPPEILCGTKIIHINGRHINSCLRICETADEYEVKISFDGGAGRYREELDRFIPLTDIFIAAKNFTDSFTGETDIKWAAEYILNKGPELVVITDGINGSWIYTEAGESFHQPAYIIDNVIDTTGCGDCYHGAFLYCLINELDLKEAASFASAAASLNTQALGGRTALPDACDVNKFLEDQKIEL